jgi:hypothetical protein
VAFRVLRCNFVLTLSEQSRANREGRAASRCSYERHYTSSAKLDSSLRFYSSSSDARPRNQLLCAACER